MRHRKQIILFLAAVLIPSLTLVFFTREIVRQEKELSAKRVVDERRRRAQEIGREILLHLERIKLEESKNEKAILAYPDEYRPSRPEIVMLGQVDEGRLVLPWELRPLTPVAGRTKSENPDVKTKIRAGERAEFERKDFALAADLYRQAHAASEYEDKDYARLLLARVLTKSGKTAEALAHLRILLALPSRQKDEDGIPLYLYAADRLMTLSGDGERVAARIGAALEEKPWMFPPEASMVDSILARISTHPGTADQVKPLITRLRDTLSTYLIKAERLLALQKGFARYMFSLRPEGPDRPSAPIWEVDEKGEWLIGLGPSQTDRHLLFLVDVRALSETLRSNADFRKAYPDEILLTTAGEPAGEALSQNLMGLNIVFLDPQASFAALDTGPTRPFYILTMAAVVIFASLGGYLLWRDVQRDLNVAEIRSQFAASVSHELKTPLTAIRMFAETMRLGRIKDEETRYEYLDTIVNESERLSRLLSNVLDMSKIEQGKKLYRPRPCALASIVRTAVRTMEYPLRQQGFSLQIEIEDDLPEVCVDPDALEQALLNLIGNAIKYSGTAREIGLKLTRSGTWALIQVTDRGVGIPLRDRQRIFEKYYRVASRENEQVPGTGLGLSLVAHFVQAHGGRVEVDGAPGHGSTFSLFLPLEGGA